MGAVQEAVLKAMVACGEPLRPTDVCRIVSELLCGDVSYDTVASFLSTASRSDKWPIERVAIGEYAIRRETGR